MSLKKVILELFNYKLLILSILWVAFQFSCVGPDQITIAPERLIPLVKDTPQQGFWESNDVALEYQYVEQNGAIQLSVTGQSKRGYDKLVVWVNLVDAQGKILETKSIFNSGYRSERSHGKSQKGTIEKTLEMPPGTTAIAFESLLKTRRSRR